ncbi:hypothetical protein [Thermomonospora umbrina]|uniref:Uncharacterized protein n=1 Tax=Thermomonospora umbrina TaxID=111806 RepID=A0A3D9T5X4_9ACTN|nr:hypothetical protein [Thermomonospora umbrina]REF00646.1 hypothetical protein DFJ69_6202 [Thermomonospora umbrina]
MRESPQPGDNVHRLNLSAISPIELPHRGQVTESRPTDNGLISVWFPNDVIVGLPPEVLAPAPIFPRLAIGDGLITDPREARDAVLSRMMHILISQQGHVPPHHRAQADEQRISIALATWSQWPVTSLRRNIVTEALMRVQDHVLRAERLFPITTRLSGKVVSLDHAIHVFVPLEANIRLGGYRGESFQYAIDDHDVLLSKIAEWFGEDKSVMMMRLNDRIQRMVGILGGSPAAPAEDRPAPVGATSSRSALGPGDVAPAQPDSGAPTSSALAAQDFPSAAPAERRPSRRPRRSAAAPRALPPAPDGPAPGQRPGSTP